jgi:hypothetical protein
LFHLSFDFLKYFELNLPCQQPNLDDIMNYPPLNNRPNPSQERNGMNNENMSSESNSRNGRNTYERIIPLSGQPRQNTMNSNEVSGHDTILNGGTLNGGMDDPTSSTRNMNNNVHAANNLLARLHILGNEGEVRSPDMSRENNTGNPQLNGQSGYTNNTVGNVSLRGGPFNIHLGPDRGVNGGSFEPSLQTEQQSPWGHTGNPRTNGATSGRNFESSSTGMYDEYLNNNIPPKYRQYYRENMGIYPATGSFNQSTSRNAPSSMINQQEDRQFSLRTNKNFRTSYIGSDQANGPMSVYDRATPPNVLRTSGEGNETEIVSGAIVIKNIPFHVRKEQLKHLMEESLKLPVSYAFNYHFSDNEFRGLAFANYEFDSDAQVVIQAMNGRKVEGRVLQVQPKNKLPVGQREQAERIKRARRGQLLEQHQPIPDDQVQTLPSLSFEPGPQSNMAESIHSHNSIPPWQLPTSPQGTQTSSNTLVVSLTCSSNFQTLTMSNQ